MHAWLDLILDKGFFGTIIIPAQNGNVETIKVEETLKEKDVEKRIRNKKN